jgi:hypothetical protein
MHSLHRKLGGPHRVYSVHDVCGINVSTNYDRVRQMIILVNNELTTVPKQLRNFECYLPQLTANHCPTNKHLNIIAVGVVHYLCRSVLINRRRVQQGATVQSS